MTMIRVKIEVEGNGRYSSSEQLGDDVVRALLLALAQVAGDLESPRLLEVVEAAWGPIIRNPQASDPTPQCQMTLDATGRRCGKPAAAIAREGAWKGYVCEEDVPRAREAGYVIEPLTP